jgi:hypothetical protein
MSTISENTRNKYTCVHLYAHILKYDNTVNECTQIEGKTPTRFTKFSQWTNTWIATYGWWWATITTGYLSIYICCFSSNSIMHTKWSTDRFSNISNNGRAYTDEQKNWPCSGQMITFTKKLKNLKYELLMTYLGVDIHFLSYVQSVTESKVKY